MYQAAVVSALSPPSSVDGRSESRLVNLCGGAQHALGCLGQHLSLAVEAGEVEAHQQGAGLDIGDLVREEVGECLGDLVGRHLVRMPQGPEPGEQRLEVDARGVLDDNGAVCRGRRHGEACDWS